jgi:hypothetical protein
MLEFDGRRSDERRGVGAQGQCGLRKSRSRSARTRDLAAGRAGNDDLPPALRRCFNARDTCAVVA